MVKLNKLFILIIAATSTSVFAGAIGTGGVLATPTVYDITIKKIEFKTSTGTFVTFSDTAGTMSLGSDALAANTSAGTLAAGKNLPAGTYTHLRTTLSRDFDIAVTGTSNSQICRTDSSIATGTYIDNAYTGNVEMPKGTKGGTATTQTMTVIPSELETSMNNTDVMNISATELQILFPFSFTKTAKEGLGKMNIEFDVGSSINVYYTAGGDCTIMVMPPQIFLTLPDGSTPDFKFSAETGGGDYGY
ncbi:MAG TPA: DUF4382 domain-containing protein [Piscirickettsiaceae bacterium]|nr:DUF4382 domain-containing protein [Piscirickettsiaceae bacterium]